MIDFLWGDIVKILKLICNRIFIVSLALLAQVFFLFYVSDYFAPAELTARILSFFVIGYVLNQIKNPSIAMTWTLFIIISPVFGSVLYLLMGGKRPGRQMRRAYEKSAMKVNRIKGLSEPCCEVEASEYLKRLGFPLYKNTSAKYFPLGDDAFPVMLQELEKAEKFIFMEYFILDDGEMLSKIEAILERKVKEGVDVRVIYDDMGSLFTLPHNYWQELEKKGIKCFSFNRFVPIMSAVMNHRDHRKILVVDSRVAFTGGINIADEYINKKVKYGHWKDNAVMIKGEGVKEFTAMFLTMWKAYRKDKEDISVFFPEEECEEQGYVQPFADSPVDDDLTGENLYMDYINNAKKYIYIFTPYLIPDQVMIRSLSLAAEKGVDVKIMVPGIPDKKIVYALTKSYYGPLIQAGVEIYKYTPGFLHSKGFVCDDTVACTGTVNIDFRSLYHHFECGCMIYNSPAVTEVKEDFVSTLEKCEKIEKYQKIKGVIGTTYHAILRLIAPLM